MGGNDEREQTLNQLLVEMDGFESNKGVIIMAATNRPEILDPALLRPGGSIEHPGGPAGHQRPGSHPENPFQECAACPEWTCIDRARTPGLWGADLANLVNEAALLAARKGKEKVEPADFDRRSTGSSAGWRKKKRVMNPKEKEIIASMRPGHALVAESVPFADSVHKISIIPRGSRPGLYPAAAHRGRYLMTRSELLDRLAVL